MNIGSHSGAGISESAGRFGMSIRAVCPFTESEKALKDSIEAAKKDSIEAVEIHLDSIEALKIDLISYNIKTNPKEAVDLGLPSGVKWATCNIGATTPEGIGSYFLWGKTTTKPPHEPSNSQTDISGDATHDSARANWGGSWRMPTETEIKELLDNCTPLWASINNVIGYILTGPNGNSIFLPAISTKKDQRRIGGYWSSTPADEWDAHAHTLIFLRNDLRCTEWPKKGVLCIRPVSD